MNLSRGRHGLLAWTLALGALWLAMVTVASNSSSTPELIENIAFETSGLEGWSLITAGNGKGQLAREATTLKGETNSHVLRFTVLNPSERCGVGNRGGKGIQVTAGGWYDLTFSARAEKRENDRGYGLTVSLESPDGRQVFARTTLPEVGGDWKNYTVALNARVSDTKARLVITLSEPGTIWFDDVSLRARLVDDRPKK